MHKSKLSKMLLAIFLASVIIVPISVGAAKTFKAVKINKLNIVNYIYNKKGKVKIKDALTVTKKALFKKNVEIQGNLEVAGTLTGDAFTALEDVTAEADISILDTSTLVGGEMFYNEADSKLYVYNGASMVDLTQQDTDTNTEYTAGTNVSISDFGVISSTDTNTTYTAGSNLSLTGTEFDVDQSGTFAWTGQHSFSTYNPQILGDNGSIIFNAATETDTDYWIGLNTDSEGDNDDKFEIGIGTTPGSNTLFTAKPGNAFGDYIGINDESPVTNLDINYALRLSPSALVTTTCSASTEGTMYYNSIDQHVCLCTDLGLGAGYKYYYIDTMTNLCTEPE